VSVLAHWLEARSVRAPRASIAVARGSASVVPGDTGLPDTLPGVDLQDGLRRVGGNTAAYQRLLSSFHSRFRWAARDVAILLDQGKLEEARLFAHTLRGVAGNLGVLQVALDATRIEDSIRAGVLGELTTQCAALHASLERVMSGLAELEEPAESERFTDDLIRTRVQRLPSEVVEGLRAATCRASLRAVEDSLQSAAAHDPALADALGGLAEQFDYVAIQRLLP
jgi:HPt (histidine-containing phosphotransfer) domain-containing protein